MYRAQPVRAARHLGSFKINLRTYRWADSQTAADGAQAPGGLASLEHGGA